MGGSRRGKRPSSLFFPPSISYQGLPLAKPSLKPADLGA